MFYIGSHKGDQNDGYVCSSKAMLSEYKIRSQDFERKILLIGADRYVVEAESAYLKAVDAAKNPIYYNMINSYPEFSMAGKRFTEDHKRKISEGHKNAPEHIKAARSAAITARLKGHTFTQETRELMSRNRKGRKLSKEHIEKMRAATKGRPRPDMLGRTPWNKGVKATQETIKRLSAARLGTKLTDEHKAKISLANKGRKLSEETKEKIGNSKRGKPLSEIAKQRMSISAKNRTDRKRAHQPLGASC